MKYLKYFEDVPIWKNVDYELEEKPKVWIISLKMPNFLISLEKLEMPDKDIDHWMKNYKNNVFTEYGKFPDRKTITIERRKYIDKKNFSFTWYWYPTSKSSEYFDFMGILKITPTQIKKYYDEIEFKKDVKNFNL